MIDTDEDYVNPFYFEEIEPEPYYERKVDLNEVRRVLADWTARLRSDEIKRIFKWTFSDLWISKELNLIALRELIELYGSNHYLRINRFFRDVKRSKSEMHRGHKMIAVLTALCVLETMDEEELENFSKLHRKGGRKSTTGYRIIMIYIRKNMRLNLSKNDLKHIIKHLRSEYRKKLQWLNEISMLYPDIIVYHHIDNDFSFRNLRELERTISDIKIKLLKKRDAEIDRRKLYEFLYN